jgi:hypothetical protein
MHFVGGPTSNEPFASASGSPVRKCLGYCLEIPEPPPKKREFPTVEHNFGVGNDGETGVGGVGNFAERKSDLSHTLV